jgi:hypothetical protein
MSWWNLPDIPDHVTGDGPADSVDQALLALPQKPSLAELLRGLELALVAKRAHLAELPDAVTLATCTGERAAPEAPAHLTAALECALEGIAEAFQRDQQRLPRLAEVLYTFTFALGGEPQTVLRPPFPKRIVLTAR